MAISNAKLTGHRQSPRKVRLVADYVRGKKVTDALVELDFLGKRAGKSVKKLIASALANAKDKGHNGDDLYVSEIRVDDGPTMFRREMRAQGRSNVIRKRTSHIQVALDVKEDK
jgi:large subunit ribosomal protein L22